MGQKATKPTKTAKVKGTSPENCKSVLTVIRRKPGVGRMEIAEKTNLDLPVVGRVLHKLKAQGDIKVEGSFRWATYQAKPQKTAAKARKAEAKA
jgi:ribosomal protein S25